MKKDLHPTYYRQIKATCVCGGEFMVGSTREQVRVDLCSACHPVFTGKNKIVDTEGRVDRFRKRFKLAKTV